MEILKENGISNTIVHGSIARGDVDKYSDIDISILKSIPSYMIEYALNPSDSNNVIAEKRISMATPNHAIKGHIVTLDQVEVVFPLSHLKDRETEFYKFSGFLALNDLEKKEELFRVKGVNKRLLFINPTSEGYWEESILGREHEVARELGVDISIVEERVRVLSRRDKIGRSGQFFSFQINKSQHFESVVKDLSSKNPIVRRRLRS